MKSFQLLFALLFIVSCKNTTVKETPNKTNTENEATTTNNTDISAISTKDFREFKVLDSKFINLDDLWKPFENDLQNFTEAQYTSLKPLILEQDIPTLQKHIQSGKLTYEILVKFYLYRIKLFDRTNELSLNSVISLNPKVIEQAKQKDKEFKNKRLKHPIFGMPILLKDNINTADMPTTAGAVVFQNNQTDDAFIVKKLKDNGALILGKANLSEWAYFFCSECPSGYSAIGGQTLNPYGRRVIDTGGSSSGSGVSVAANFCAAAIGSETAGSILSPASQNSTVGLKPTVGLLSRSGIVPISSTLDTPGPITKNVIDNAIVLGAMFGEDTSDSKSIYALWDSDFYYENIVTEDRLKGKRFGVFKRLLEDNEYKNAIAVLKSQGAEIIEINEEKVDLPEFIRLLNLDMKKDLPEYIKTSGSSKLGVKSISDVMTFNQKDSANVMPYGQMLFKGVNEDNATEKELEAIKKTLYTNGTMYFDTPMKANNLDGILSINNYHAAFAAVAEYPAITVPMGYNANGAPKGLTFIAERLKEKMLYQWAYAYEQASKVRKAPKDYN
jgi:amidase